jgi:hypothetical protein
MFKKIALITLLISPNLYADHRPVCLSAIGVASVIAALCLIFEKNKEDNAVLAGTLLFAVGVSTIIASNDLILWYDRPAGMTFSFRF